MYLRGGLGPRAAIARPVFRRVPTGELDELVDAARRSAGSTGARTARASGRFSTARPTTSSACSSGASRRGAGGRRRPHEQHRAARRSRGGRAVGRVRGSASRGTCSSGRSSRFGDRLALSTAFQDGDVALIDMAYAHRPGRSGLLDRHRPAAPGDPRPDRAAPRAVSGPAPRASLARRRAAAAPRRPARAEPVPPVGRAAAPLLQRPQGAAAEPRAGRPRRLGHRAFAATSGRRGRTSARSRSTTTTTRS